MHLEGYGVRLREWSDADLADLVTLYEDPEMAGWTPVASPFDLAAARAYLAGARAGRAEGRKVQLGRGAGLRRRARPPGAEAGRTGGAAGEAVARSCAFELTDVRT
ncbi:GNAT family N-acetyltransferase [Streptomyces sviceus]|uniref:hypothetical protein n=1 Tax=Streptomyces sviceus TaxID=285530 RepID=UPI0036E89905